MGSTVPRSLRTTRILNRWLFNTWDRKKSLGITQLSAKLCV